jgi:hypothetical protein
MTSWTRRSLALLLLTTLAGCAEPPRAAPPALTHQWRAPAGASLFVDVSMGAAPDGAADRLMAVMPTIVHRLGELCKESQGAAAAGSFVLSFGVRDGGPVSPAVDPQSALATCTIEALPAAIRESAAGLAGLPPVEVVVLLQHAPG